MSYTEKWSERWQLLGGIEPPEASHSTEQNSGRIDISNFSRIAVVVRAYDGGAETLDIDHEQADAASGGTLKALHSSDFDVTMAADENAVVFEIQAEQFDTNGYFGWYNLEITPSGARNFSAEIYGLVQYAPAEETLWDQVIEYPAV